MDNFNFNRFGKVVKHDFKNAISLYGISMLIIMLLPLALWILNLTVDHTSYSEVKPWTRMSIINFLTTLAAALAPIKIFGSSNLRNKGIYFAMLPASKGEKFWSMALYCYILVPLTALCGCCVVDIILTALPFGPFKTMFWTDASYFFFSEYGNKGLRIIQFLSGIFLVTSLFMYSNTIFKKNKFIRTILWVMLISFVLIIILVPLMENGFFEWLEKWGDLDQYEPDVAMRRMMWSGIAAKTIMGAILAFLTYRRLKKMQY